MITGTQWDNDTFELSRDGHAIDLYIYKVAIGGGENAYYVKKGHPTKNVKGETIGRSHESRKAAMAWIEKNI